MAKYKDVLNVFKTVFNDLDGKFSVTELNDRLYIEIQNDRKTLENILTCKPRSVRGIVWNSLLNLINGILEYNEIETGVTSTQVKKALTVVYGNDIYNAVLPTVEYYENERLNRGI